MQILLIDTANPTTKIAILSNEKVIREENFQKPGELSNILINRIDQLLTAYQVEAILVNRGPGSYTGLRIGITVANFLGLSLNIPVYGANMENPEKEAKSLSQEFTTGKFTEPIKPFYQNPPKITQSKSRR